MKSPAERSLALLSHTLEHPLSKEAHGCVVILCAEIRLDGKSQELHLAVHLVL